MLSLIYLISAALCIWGGCLIARLIANRLERGLFRRKLRRALSGASPHPSVPTPPRRSAWWTLVGFIGLLIGGAGAFIGYGVGNVARSLNEQQWVQCLVAGLVCIGLGLIVGLGLVGFRFDPALGRRRCPKCWYDLSATTGLLCAECGHEAQDERHLHRSRRSKPTIALALVLLLFLPFTIRIAIALKVGWIGLVPTTVMVLAFEYLPDSMLGQSNAWGNRPFDGTLLSRIDRNQLLKVHRAYLAWRCESIISTSTDPKDILRALALVPDDSAVFAISSARVPMLVARLSDPDIETARAAAALLQAIPQSNEPDPEMDKAIADAAPSLAALALSPGGVNEEAASAAARLLAKDGTLNTLAENDPEKIEALITDPTTTWLRRRDLVAPLARASPASKTMVDLFLRLLDTPDSSIRKHLCNVIFYECSHPRIVARALRMIREDTPEYASIAASASTFTTIPPEPDQRDRAQQVSTALIDRFVADPASRSTLFPAIQQLRQQGVMPEADIHRVYAPLLDLLSTGKPADVNVVLNFLSSYAGPSPELRQALDAHLAFPDLDPAVASQLRAIRTQYFPPQAP